MQKNIEKYATLGRNRQEEVGEGEREKESHT